MNQKTKERIQRQVDRISKSRSSRYRQGTGLLAGKYETKKNKWIKRENGSEDFSGRYAREEAPTKEKES